MPLCVPRTITGARRNHQTAAEGDLRFHRSRDIANKGHAGSVIRVRGIRSMTNPSGALT